jgi:hypothetical protein
MERPKINDLARLLPTCPREGAPSFRKSAAFVLSVQRLVAPECVRSAVACFTILSLLLKILRLGVGYSREVPMRPVNEDSGKKFADKVTKATQEAFEKGTSAA